MILNRCLFNFFLTEYDVKNYLAQKKRFFIFNKVPRYDKASI